MNIEVRLGSRVRIDGELFTCCAVSETLHSDFGAAPVVKCTTATMVNNSGFKVKLSEEREE